MKKNIIFWVLLLALLNSCNDDYIIGGKANETNRFEGTTFELLNRMEETDTVALLFERAGYKEVINGDVTVIVPNKWSVNRYLRRRHNQELRNNPDAPELTINDISAEELRQMGMYIFPGKYWRETIPEEGVYLTGYDGSTEILLTVDETNTDPGSAYDGGGTPGAGYQYSNFMQEVPYIIHVHYKRGNNWEMTAEERNNLSDYYDNPECDHVYRMYISDILTTNGVVHVLYQGDYSYSDHYYYHSLFFYGTRDDDTL